MPEKRAAKSPRSCPICGKPAVAQYRPFCSARCQDVDLNRWLSGAYRAPAAEAPKGPEDEAPPDEE